MTRHEAVQFIQRAVLPGPYTWADLGAGSGLFAQTMAGLLGPEGAVLAIDRSEEVLAIPAVPDGAPIYSRQADFTDSLALPPLDGILMANALHFIRRQAELLVHLLQYLKPGGIFVLIEYDNRHPNPWVPYPVSARKFPQLAAEVGLNDPVELHRQASRYGQGMLYSAMAKKQ